MAHFNLRTFACLMLACFLFVAPHTEADVSCGAVISALNPCMGYLRSGGALDGSCCSGVVSLNNGARTTADRRATCTCLQKAAKGISGLDMGRAGSLPSKCGVNIPYKISLSTNCATVK
ncbi:non-specific lipid-transfer protein 1-like [Magnolia sinica]|uniref:non-specific lipid-transfer protein 1-like n=1 Tax=Magnolia sinica TaxID=86752 RepID=UPI002659A43A|nr:non-specific lipid-transfer protein 1-like [Magnolia sinica]